MTALELLTQQIENRVAYVRVERENVARSFVAIAKAEGELEDWKEAVKRLKNEDER